MKAVIKCHETEKWTEVLPLVMLGIRTAYKEDLQISPAEMVYGSQIHIPGEFSTPSQKVSESEFVKQLHQRINKQKPIPTTRHGNKRTFIYKEIKTTPFMFLRNEAQKVALQPTYEGPYKVIRRTEKNFVIEKKGQEIRLSNDRLKPAHTLDGTNNTLPRKDSSLQETQNIPEEKITIQIKSGRRVRFTERYQASFT